MSKLRSPQGSREKLTIRLMLVMFNDISTRAADCAPCHPANSDSRKVESGKMLELVHIPRTDSEIARATEPATKIGVYGTVEGGGDDRIIARLVIY